jgi:hypothetical protein
LSLLLEYEPGSIEVHLVLQPRRFEGGAFRADKGFAVPFLRKSVIGKVTSPS